MTASMVHVTNLTPGRECHQPCPDEVVPRVVDVERVVGVQREQQALLAVAVQVILKGRDHI
jgi:hypothetical protein